MFNRKPLFRALALGTALMNSVAAYAQTAPVVAPNSAAIVQPPSCRTWHVDADRFASSEDEAMRKLHALMQQLIAYGTYSAEDAATIEKVVTTQQGTDVTIDKGYYSAWMAGGKDISHDLCYGPKDIPSKVKHIQHTSYVAEYGKEWPVHLSTGTWVITLFKICHNFAGQRIATKITPPAPPPITPPITKSDCVEVDIRVRPHTLKTTYEEAGPQPLDFGTCVFKGAHVDNCCTFDKVELEMTHRPEGHKSIVIRSHARRQVILENSDQYRTIKLYLPVAVLDNYGFAFCVDVLDSNGILHHSKSVNKLWTGEITDQRVYVMPYADEFEN